MPGEDYVGEQQIHGGHDNAADHHWETDSVGIDREARVLVTWFV